MSEIHHPLLTLSTLASLFVLFILFIAALVFFRNRANSLSSSLQHANSLLDHLGTHDTLTKLPNRLMLGRHLHQSIEASKRNSTMFAVLCIDLDGFKAINDSLGRAAGDILLETCATRLGQNLRHNDMVARIGGDEFAIVVSNMLDASVAGAIANSMLRELSREIVIDETRLRISASIGIALFPQDGQEVEVLLHCADAAMYEAKQNGRHAFRFFEHSMNTNTLKTLMLQRDLQYALEQGHLSLAFQPKFNIADRSLAGAEALIRWRHPEIGDIPPLEFIAAAERSGQIIEIGEWVIKEVCRLLSEWDAQGLPAVQIAINLSPVQFNAPDLAQHLDAIIQAARIAPARIMFEITESAAMQNADKTTATVHEFHLRGFDMAIDDFGTGYSSLAYLQRFQVKQIKIDGFFVRELDAHEKEGRALLSAIVTLARALNMDVVAEGVETETQLKNLAALNCDQAQGFLLSQPLSATDFQQFLRDIPGAASGSRRDRSDSHAEDSASEHRAATRNKRPA